MYNIIRIDEDKNGKSEILTTHLNSEDEVEKLLDEKFKIYREAVFQTYLRLRKDIQTEINETLTIIETCNSISVEHKIGEQAILWHYALREASYTKSEYTHYINKTKSTITHKAVKNTKD